MKRIFVLIWVVLALLLTSCFMMPLKESLSFDLRVMTFNIRNGYANDGNNRWDLRKEFVCDVIRDFAPDVLGIQEAYRFQLDECNKRLPEYGEVGVGRDGGSKGEYSAILYQKNRFNLIDSGTFWLSETPTVPSKNWGSACRRICTWALLSDKKSEQLIYVYNTHLDHHSQQAREESARLLMKHINNRTPQEPFVLMGDFNAGEDNPLVGYLKGVGSFEKPNIVLVDSYRVLFPDMKDVGTFNNFEGREQGPKIDYIFVTPDTQTLEAGIVKTNRDGRYPSDHFPVTAQLRFEQKSGSSNGTRP